MSQPQPQPFKKVEPNPNGVEGVEPLVKPLTYQQEYYIKNKEKIYHNQMKYYHNNKSRIKQARRQSYFQKKMKKIEEKAIAFKKSLEDGTYKPLFGGTFSFVS